MWVRAKLHAMFKIGVKDPDGVVELTLPDGTDVTGLAEALREVSPTLDPRACLAMIGGTIVPLDRALKDGEEVHFYPTLTGG
jgi:molybdopterin converting factor small subunit